MIGQTELYEVDNPPSLSVYLLGRRITFMTVSAIVDAIHTACIEGIKLTVANYNVHSFNLSMQLPWFHNFLQSAEITHCDSVGILRAVGYMGLKLPLKYRASYSLLMPKLLSHCDQQNFSVFLLGAKPECLNAAIAQVAQQYPNLKIGGHHGYFDIRDSHQNSQVVEQINQAKPQILVVGMGMPIQEDWIRLNRDQLDVNVIMMGGAVIDRLAGVVPACPPVLSNLGLEWLYRLCREPKRLATRYLLGNPAFAFHIALAKAYSFSLKVQQMEPINRSKKLSSNEGAEPTSNSEHLEDRLIEANLVS